MARSRSLGTRTVAAVVAALAASFVTTPLGADVSDAWAAKSGLPNKKADVAAVDARLLSTLVQTHTDERVPLDDHSPTADRFSSLLADRVTGERIAFDPRLLELLRALARKHPGARFELVSGFRSPKLNEMMRKKGRHVASHSQHSLGHAVDFRIVPFDAERGVHPRVLEKEIRELGWVGGVGTYLLPSDWFVHADVGRKRRWGG